MLVIVMVIVIGAGDGGDVIFGTYPYPHSISIDQLPRLKQSPEKYGYEGQLKRDDHHADNADVAGLDGLLFDICRKCVQ